MNNERRKAIDAILVDLTLLQEAVDKLPGADDIKTAIEEVAEQEREYYDNMHENLQGGEKGTAADEAATNLEEAANECDELGLSDLSEKVAEIIAKLEAARDGG